MERMASIGIARTLVFGIYEQLGHGGKVRFEFATESATGPEPFSAIGDRSGLRNRSALQANLKYAHEATVELSAWTSTGAG
jgi:hypothetical protein